MTNDQALDHSSRNRAAHELNLRVQNDRAVQVVAGQASDLDDCIELLAMLGLDAHPGGPTSHLPRTG